MKTHPDCACCRSSQENFDDQTDKALIVLLRVGGVSACTAIPPPATRPSWHSDPPLTPPEDPGDNDRRRKRALTANPASGRPGASKTKTRCGGSCGAPGSVRVCFLFGFVCLARHGKVNDVEPREDTRENRVQNRTIPMPRTYNSDRRTESYPCLGNRLRCLVGNLSNDHRVLTER